MRADGGDARGGAVAAFARRYGWRAYALPVLAVLTVLALLTAGHAGRTSAAPPPPAAPAGTTASGPPTAQPSQTLKVDVPGAGSDNSVLAAAALPSGPAYTTTGAGTYRVLPGSGPVVGTGPLKRYSIDVENGVTGVDLTQFASIVQTTLSDRRSWIGATGTVSLQRVDSGEIDFHVTLTSSMTVRRLCGYELPVETSCFAPSVDRVALNVARWVRGDAAYIGDLAAYRVYMVNHEDGHALGHQHSHQCLPGGVAPVMMQQTLGLQAKEGPSAGQLCTANPWPYPPGVAGAPGPEDPDTAANSEASGSGD